MPPSLLLGRAPTPAARIFPPSKWHRQAEIQSGPWSGPPVFLWKKILHSCPTGRNAKDILPSTGLRCAGPHRHSRLRQPSSPIAPDQLFNPPPCPGPSQVKRGSAPPRLSTLVRPDFAGYGVRARPRPARGGLVKIAICVCTCKRPISLGRLLDSLAHLRLGGLAVDFVELIVIDNSPDGVARRLCAASSSRLPIKLHFDEEPNRGISFARNRAVDVALERGADLVAFIDDDDVPEPDRLCHLIRKQEQTGADLVFGRWSFATDSEVPAWIRDNLQFRSSDYDKRDIHALPAWASTCNVMISSRLLREMKDQGAPFSPDFAFLGGEDKDFFIRALAMGASYATSARSMVIRHDVEDRFTTMGILRRSFQRVVPRLT